MMLTKHYFKRGALDPIDALAFTALPIIMFLVSDMLTTGMGMERELSRSISAMATFAGFQMISSAILAQFLYSDFMTDMKWRLGAAPCNKGTFVKSIMLASWFFSFITGIIYFVVVHFAFGANFGNLLVAFGVLFLLSIMAQAIAVLVFNLTSKLGAAQGVTVGFGIVMMNLFFLMNVGNDAVRVIFTYGNPVALATRVMSATITTTGPHLFFGDMRSASTYLAILVVYVIVLTILAFVVSKVRVKEGYNDHL